MEFNLAWYMNGYHVSVNMSFRELQWMNERVMKQLEHDKNSDNNMGTMLNNMK